MVTDLAFVVAIVVLLNVSTCQTTGKSSSSLFIYHFYHHRRHRRRRRGRCGANRTIISST